MNTRKLLILIAVVVAIPIGYWLISPLFIERRVDERVEDIMMVGEDVEESIITVAQGEFEGIGIHNATGTATLIRVGDKHFVRFEDGFEVTNGPDLFVHFGKDGEYVAEARLGELKGNVGGQNYEVPAGLNSEDYNEVWVWCRAFATPFAKAVLN